tara:strand:+ start:78 stop:503 length:426 start_codon:yes stop_codon:yes gene_type:complete
MKLKKKELRDIIKPIVEECVKDVLLSGGLLSSIISEVVAGVNGATTIVEAPEAKKPVVSEAVSQQARVDALKKKREKLLNAIGSEAYNGVDIFEGTEPLKKGGSPKKSGGYAPFEGVDPSDPGVDITALTENLGSVWKKLS